MRLHSLLLRANARIHARTAGRKVPLLPADHVTATVGTGLVHTAPGHGPDDFLLGQARGLEPMCPVDEQGKFTAAIEESAPFAGVRDFKFHVHEITKRT